MLFTTKQLGEIKKVGKFNELEMRFKFPQELIMDLFNRCNDGKITTSVVMLQGITRRESVYVNNVKTNDFSIIEKTKVLTINIYDKINLVFSHEKPINNFDTAKTELIRLKYRYSFNLFGGRLEFTIIKKCSPLMVGLRDTIAAFFNKPTGEWELEYEFGVGMFKKGISIIELNRIILEVYRFLDIDYFFTAQITELANYMKMPGRTSLKQLTNNPIMLDKTALKKINLKNFMILEKSDGVRCVVKLYDNKNYIYIVEGAVGNHLTLEAESEMILLDCEKIDDEFLVFDLILYENKLLDNDYNDRIKIIKSLKIPSNFKIKEILPATCENLKYFEKRIGETDGIIFNELNKPYRDMIIYKWKPANMITFDFLIVPMPYKGLKPFISDKNLYVLMCGCSKKKYNLTTETTFTNYKDLMQKNNIPMGNYFPIPFAPPLWREAYVYESSEKFPLCVGEFQYIGKKWKLLKIREDKTLLIGKQIYGNDYFTAEQHFNELQNPITIGDICNHETSFSGGGYFQKNKTQQYKSGIKFNNYVKFRCMSKMAGFNKILDLASGKGQDIFIYNGIGVKHVTFVEPDGDSFIELNNRLKSLNTADFYVHTEKPEKNMKSETINSSYENLQLNNRRFDAIVCNFAIHYMLVNDKAYEDFAKFCQSTGARIVLLTYFDSEMLERAMPLENEKYKVIKLDKKRISVKHHFSETPYVEYLVDTQLLIENMSLFGYDLLIRDSFGRYLQTYEFDLEELDKQYSSFYQYVIFRVKN